MRFDSQGAEVGSSRAKESDGTVLGFIGHDASKGDAGSIINGDMDIFPSRTFDDIAAVAGDAMAGPFDPSKLFDIEVNELPWVSALVAAHWGRRIQQG